MSEQLDSESNTIIDSNMHDIGLSKGDLIYGIKEQSLNEKW